MTFQEAIDAVCSEEFAVRFGIASNLQALLRGARMDPSVRELFSRTQESPDYLKCLITAYRDLVGEGFDARYVHPHDIALTILLYIMAATDLKVAAALASAEPPRGGWYSEKYRRVIVSTQIQQSGNLEGVLAAPVSIRPVLEFQSSNATMYTAPSTVETLRWRVGNPSASCDANELVTA